MARGMGEFAEQTHSEAWRAVPLKIYRRYLFAYSTASVHKLTVHVILHKTCRKRCGRMCRFMKFAAVPCIQTSKKSIIYPLDIDRLQKKGALFLRRITLKTVLARLGRCGKAVIFLFLRIIGLMLWGILMGAAEVFGFLLRGLAHLADAGVSWVRARRRNAACAVRAFRRPARSQLQSVLRIRWLSKQQ